MSKTPRTIEPIDATMEEIADAMFRLNERPRKPTPKDFESEVSETKKEKTETSDSEKD